MFKQLMRRKDTRLEVIGVTVVFLLIMALCFSGRKQQSPSAIAPPAGPPLQSRTVLGWTLDLMRLEECPARKIVVAVIRVHGAPSLGLGSHVSDVEAPGLQFDGGAWSDAAVRASTFPYAGACGAWEQCGILPGEGLLILRLRGTPTSGKMPLYFRLAGREVQFAPAPLSSARDSATGLVGTIFGR